MKRAILAILLIALVGVGIWYYLDRETIVVENNVETSVPATTESPPIQPGVSSGPENEVMFRCAGGKTITAVFTRDIVGLTLEDGAQYELREAASTSGAKYADEFRGIVFWGDGDTAFLEQKSVITHRDCVVAS